MPLIEGIELESQATSFLVCDSVFSFFEEDRTGSNLVRMPDAPNLLKPPNSLSMAANLPTFSQPVSNHPGSLIHRRYRSHRRIRFKSASKLEELCKINSSFGKVLM